MGYTNSKLVSYTKLSPNHSGKRQHSIDRITPHCVVGQVSVETLGNIFQPTSIEASSNYGIGVDGRVGMYVEEKNRSWCSSSSANDNRAVTIECASDAYHPYAFKDVVYKKLITLCVDICKRNGKSKLLWLGSKDKTLNYSPASNEMVLTVHRWFDNKSCPGDWMYARMGDLAKQVTAKLNGKIITTSTKETASTVKLDADGILGEKTIKVLQKYLNKNNKAGLDVDGILGKKSIKALQKFLNSKNKAGLVVDGILGKNSIKALQRFLNSKNKAGLDVDGILGKETIKALQKYLNKNG